MENRFYFEIKKKKKKEEEEKMYWLPAESNLNQSPTYIFIFR